MCLSSYRSGTAVWPLRPSRFTEEPHCPWPRTCPLGPSTDLNVQLCGDAHLSNFGGFASPERDLVFDINDFDETAVGPFEWDVKRLATSLEVAGRELGYSGRRLREIVLQGVRTYRHTIRLFARTSKLDTWYARLDVPAILERWGSKAGTNAVKNFQRAVAQG